MEPKPDDPGSGPATTRNTISPQLTYVEKGMQMLVNFHMSTNPSDTVISLLTDYMLTVHPQHHIAHFVVECQHVQPGIPNVTSNKT